MPRRSERISKQVKAPKYAPVGHKQNVRPSGITRPGGKGRGRAATRVDERHVGVPVGNRKAQTSNVNVVEKNTKVSKRRGKLYQILDMPLDVIMEICLHLQTKDILNLSRLSKAFRALFTSRTTQFIWKAARLNVKDLPPCPEDLTELAYANLVFDTCCHNCQCRNCHFIYWGCRVRLCNSCYEELSTSSNYYRESSTEEIRQNGGIHKAVPPLEQLAGGTWMFYKPFLDEFMITWKGLPQDNERRREFLNGRKRATAAVMQTVPALALWYSTFRDSRANELEDVRNGRKNAIVEKLLEIGYGLELRHIKIYAEDRKRFFNLPEVRKTQALTPRVWSSVEAPILQFMQEIRRKRLWKTFEARVRKMEPVLREVIENIDGCDLSIRELLVRSPKLHDIIDLENSEFDMDGLRHTFHGLIVEYLGEREREGRQALMKMIQEETGSKKSTSPFELAIGSYFTCSVCQEVFNSQNAIQHTCPLYGTPKCPVTRPGWMSADYLAMVCKFATIVAYQQQVWTMDVFRSQFKNIANVIRACGFDPKTATVEELDSVKSLRVICKSHLAQSKYIPVMTWRTAAYGQNCCETDERLSPAYELASDEFKEAVKESEAQHRIKLRASEYGYREYRCDHCDETPELQTGLEVISHLQKKHNIMDPRKCDVVRESKAEENVTPVYLVSYRCKGKNHALNHLASEYPYRDHSHRITYWK